MKVKVGDKITCGCDEPVMVILTAQDRLNILAMAPALTKYAIIPDDFPRDEVDEWMDAK